MLRFFAQQLINVNDHHSCKSFRQKASAVVHQTVYLQVGLPNVNQEENIALHFIYFDTAG